MATHVRAIREVLDWIERGWEVQEETNRKDGREGREMHNYVESLVAGEGVCVPLSMEQQQIYSLL
jgi:hypothetical protein